jgi:antitoxin (DNA-binding transcriptional repressor) of toxin-antitoxin stability system
MLVFSSVPTHVWTEEDSVKKNEGNVVVTPSELYGNLGDIFGKVRWGKKAFVIQKHGRPMARLLSAVENGKRRYPRPEYLQVTPGQFRSRMSDLLAQVRYGNQKVLITYRGKVVAILRSAS